MIAGLTHRQRDCLNAIRALTVDGVPPSYEEIGAHIGVTARSGVHRLVHGLAERGLIRLTADRHRSMMLVEGMAPDAAMLDSLSSGELRTLIATAAGILAHRDGGGARGGGAGQDWRPADPQAAGARMRCPTCHHGETNVTDSRPWNPGADWGERGASVEEPGYGVRRRRRCPACQSRFTTVETALPNAPSLLMPDGGVVGATGAHPDSRLVRIAALLGLMATSDAKTLERIAERFADDAAAAADHREQAA